MHPLTSHHQRSARMLRITGHVQGVFFRASAKEQADILGITGWVKNCSDGSVEISAEGDAAALNEFEAWCRKGPRGARVDEVKQRESAEQGHKNFMIYH